VVIRWLYPDSRIASSVLLACRLEVEVIIFFIPIKILRPEFVSTSSRLRIVLFSQVALSAGAY